jgi:hypothetical protein
MAGGYSGKRWVYLGHTSTVAGTPSTWKFVDAQNQPVLPSADVAKLPIHVQNQDGEITAPVVGPKSGTVDIQTLVRGDGTAGGDTIVATAPSEIGALMRSATGSAGTASTGRVSTTANTDTVINVANTTGLHGSGQTTQCPSGVAIYDSDATFGWNLREVQTVVTDTSVTLDRALSFTPADGRSLFAAYSWFIDADKASHDYIRAHVEGENWKRDMIGCATTFKMNFPSGGLATIDWVLSANDWADISDTPDSTYIAPTTQTPLICQDMRFWLGNALSGLGALELIEGSLDSGLSVAPRTAMNGANGQNGWITTYNGATFSGKVYHEDFLLDTMQGGATFDMALEICRRGLLETQGNALYIRIPALSITEAKIESYNGVDVIAFTGTATRPAAGPGSVRIHMWS